MQIDTEPYRSFLLSLLPMVMCLMANTLFAQEIKPQDEVLSSVHEVRSVHVGDFGSTDAARRFVLVLEDQLTERGFHVVSSSEADLLLSGAFTLQIVGRNEDARATVRGRSQTGARIGGGEFTPRFSWRGSNDMTFRVAMATSDQLRSDVDAAKK